MGVYAIIKVGMDDVYAIWREIQKIIDSGNTAEVKRKVNGDIVVLNVSREKIIQTKVDIVGLPN